VWGRFVANPIHFSSALGYAKIEESKAKTRITGVGAKMMLSDGTGGQSEMTMLTFKACLESHRIRPEPPP